MDSLTELTRILHEGGTKNLLTIRVFMVLQRIMRVLLLSTLYLNGFLTDLASILAQDQSNHSYGYALTDLERVFSPYSPENRLGLNRSVQHFNILNMINGGVVYGKSWKTRSLNREEDWDMVVLGNLRVID